MAASPLPPLNSSRPLRGNLDRSRWTNRLERIACQGGFSAVAILTHVGDVVEEFFRSSILRHFCINLMQDFPLSIRNIRKVANSEIVGAFAGVTNCHRAVPRILLPLSTLPNW